MGADRIPSTGDRVVGLALLYNLRICYSAVCTEELVAACIKTVNRSIYRIYCKMITTLAVLCLVIDRRINNLNLTGI